MLRIPRRWIAPCLSLATVVALGLCAHAQPSNSDLIREAKQRQEIATQVAQSDVKAATQKAKKASRTEALSILKDAVKRVEDDQDIKSDAKASLVRTLKDHIRLTESSARVAGEPTPSDNIRISRAADRKAELDRAAGEREAINQALKQINALDGQGRRDEAERQARDLANKYPDNPAARLMAGSSSVRLRVRDARDQILKQERSAQSMMADLQRGATPPSGDLEFDQKRWKELDKLRPKGTALTQKEKDLLNALNAPVKAEWNNTRFEDVMEYLSTVSKQTIVFDKKTLEEQNVTYDTPVKFVAPKTISMRTALRKVLQDLGLTYVVKDELIYVTTPSRAREMMSTRVYYIGDLTTGSIDPWGNPLKVGPWIAAQAEKEMVDMIINMIKESVDPGSWQGQGGAGTITYTPLSKALVIRQSSEIHLTMKGSLGAGK